MHVLIISEKYDNPEAKKLANSFNTFSGTFNDVYENNDDYTCEHLTIFEPGYDNDGIKSAQELDEILLTKTYDVAIVSMHGDVTVSLNAAQKIGKKLFLIFYDTHMSALTSDRVTNFRMFVKSKPKVHINYVHSIFEYSQYCNCLVTDYGYGEELPNIYGITVPQIEKWMRPIDCEKIYDVSFTGSPYTNEREQFISYLNKNGIVVNLFGGRGTTDAYISVEDYAKRINQTKINLNFNHSNIQPHRVGRAYEIAACGGFMMATFPEVYKSKNGAHLVDREHFISFNQFDVIDKIKYYLNNDDERNKIANNIRQQHLAKFTSKQWWENIYKLAGIK